MRPAAARRQGAEAHRRRLLVFGINYRPEPTGIALNTTWQTQALAELGWEVNVVAGVPHYPAWRRGDAPGRSCEGGVHVTRCAHYVPHRQSVLRRGAYEATWTASAMRHALRPRDADLALAIVPALGGAVLANVAASRLKVPYAVLFQDLVGKAAEQSGMDGAGRVASSVRRLELGMAKRAARVAIVADGFRSYLVDGGVDADRIVRIRNPGWLGSATESREPVRERLGWAPDRFVVIHTGSMGYKQGLETLIQAATLARNDRGLLFVLQGDGNQKEMLERAARQQRLENVVFLPLAPADTFPGILRAADAALLSQRGSVRNMSMPGKLATYFFAGLPVIATVAPDDEVAQETELAGAGIVVEPDNPQALLDAVERLRSDPAAAAKLGQSGIRFAESALTPEAVVGGVSEFLEGALA